MSGGGCSIIQSGVAEARGGGGGLEAHNNQLPAAWEREALVRRPAALTLPPFRPYCPLPAEKSAISAYISPHTTRGRRGARARAINNNNSHDNGRSSAFFEKRVVVVLFVVLLCLFFRFFARRHTWKDIPV